MTTISGSLALLNTLTVEAYGFASNPYDDQLIMGLGSTHGTSYGGTSTGKLTVIRCLPNGAFSQGVSATWSGPYNGTTVGSVTTTVSTSELDFIFTGIWTSATTFVTSLYRHYDSATNNNTRTYRRWTINPGDLSITSYVDSMLPWPADASTRLPQPAYGTFDAPWLIFTDYEGLRLVDTSSGFDLTGITASYSGIPIRDPYQRILDKILIQDRADESSVQMAPYVDGVPSGTNIILDNSAEFDVASGFDILRSGDSSVLMLNDSGATGALVEGYTVHADGSTVRVGTFDRSEFAFDVSNTQSSFVGSGRWMGHDAGFTTTIIVVNALTNPTYWNLGAGTPTFSSTVQWPLGGGPVIAGFSTTVGDHSESTLYSYTEPPPPSGYWRNLAINPSGEQSYNRAWVGSNGAVSTNVTWEV